MRRLISVLLLLPAALSAMEVTNGSMTDGEAVPTGWEAVWTGDQAKPVTVYRDVVQFASAPASLRFENLDGASFGNLSRPLSFNPEIEFQIGAALRIPIGIERATFAIQGYDAAGTQTWWQEVVSVSAGQPDAWVTNSIRTTPPVGTTRAVMILLVSGKGLAWLDDVTVGK